MRSCCSSTPTSPTRGRRQRSWANALQGRTLPASAAPAHRPPSTAEGWNCKDNEPLFVLASQVDKGAKEVGAAAGLAAAGLTLPRTSAPRR